MKKILLVIEREFLTRVRKKSFIIMTVLTPILFAGLTVVPALIATMEDKNERHIAVVDDTGIFEGKIPETEYLKFSFLKDVDVDDLKETFHESNYYAVLYIGKMVATSPDAVVL
ncbi:MAG TPA: ABC transporter permease, partial [Tenuifilaceae bacterium]|nr:ABC transporter permease [Tenuifilaceae bacterium]